MSVGKEVALDTDVRGVGVGIGRRVPACAGFMSAAVMDAVADGGLVAGGELAVEAREDDIAVKNFVVIADEVVSAGGCAGARG